MLYATALGTGLLASELASLTVDSFDLNSGSQTVTVEAAYAKNRREDTLPLPADLPELLRSWMETVMQEPAMILLAASGHRTGSPDLHDRPEARLWPGQWAEGKEGGVMLKADLAAARKKWIEAAATEAEQAERERSDFLRYRTQAGQADFHGLRHTYLSRPV